MEITQFAHVNTYTLALFLMQKLPTNTYWAPTMFQVIKDFSLWSVNLYFSPTLLWHFDNYEKILNYFNLVLNSLEVNSMKM